MFKGRISEKKQREKMSVMHTFQSKRNMIDEVICYVFEKSFRTENKIEEFIDKLPQFKEYSSKNDCNKGLKSSYKLMRSIHRTLKSIFQF